ncbi:hypothetical protein N7494_012698 [Penicillium frequentans]|uniref:Uncharacterized protein n=1 Tax=Penicillium frequentans TaxID=3151616 RepID=A0AAD6CM22_9EURO|nr:hypothetical protein N7494_012698 [Penicillium glabrum]
MNENNTPVYPITSDESDVITGTIRDDCPECFMWLRKVIPDLDGTGVNEYGWSFLAIAGHHASFRMLNYFFTMSPYHEPCIPLLSRAANVARPTMTTMRMITDQHNVEFLRALFGFLGPRVRELNPNTGKLTREEKLCLCAFVTPTFAEQIEKIGVTLHETRDVLPFNRNAYHAAVLNSIEFLDYLYAKSSLPISVPDSGDSVLWLEEHGAKQDCKGWSRLTAAHIAVRLTSEESEKMLEAVIPAPTSDSEAIDSSALGTMLRALVEGLRETIQDEGAHINTNKQEYVTFKQMHEERAIRKCKLILDAASTAHDLSSRFANLEARDMAVSLEFGRLAEVIRSTSGTQSSPNFNPQSW